MLNGVAVPMAALVERLEPLMASANDPVILRAGEGSAVQDLVAVLDALRAGGITRVIVAE